MNLVKVCHFLCLFFSISRSKVPILRRFLNILRRRAFARLQLLEALMSMDVLPVCPLWCHFLLERMDTSSSRGSSLNCQNKIWAWILEEDKKYIFTKHPTAASPRSWDFCRCWRCVEWWSGDRWQVTSDRWHVTGDRWHLTTNPQ